MNDEKIRRERIATMVLPALIADDGPENAAVDALRYADALIAAVDQAETATRDYESETASRDRVRAVVQASIALDVPPESETAGPISQQLYIESLRADVASADNAAALSRARAVKAEAERDEVASVSAERKRAHAFERDEWSTVCRAKEARVGELETARDEMRNEMSVVTKATLAAEARAEMWRAAAIDKADWQARMTEARQLDEADNREVRAGRSNREAAMARAEIWRELGEHWRERALAAEATIAGNDAWTAPSAVGDAAVVFAALKARMAGDPDFAAQAQRFFAVVEESRAVSKCDDNKTQTLADSDKASALCDEWRGFAIRAAAMTAAAEAAVVKAESEAASVSAERKRTYAAEAAAVRWEVRARAAEEVCDRWGTRVRVLEDTNTATARVATEEKDALIEYLKVRTLERDEWRERALAAEATVVSEQADAIQWKVRALAAESAEFSNADQLYETEMRAEKEEAEAGKWKRRAEKAEGEREGGNFYTISYPEIGRWLGVSDDGVHVRVGRAQAMWFDTEKNAREYRYAHPHAGSSLAVHYAPVSNSVNWRRVETKAPKAEISRDESDTAWTDTEAATARITGCDPRTGEPLSTAEEDDDETPLAEKKDARGDKWRDRALAAEARVEEWCDRAEKAEAERDEVASERNESREEATVAEAAIDAIAQTLWEHMHIDVRRAEYVAWLASKGIDF